MDERQPAPLEASGAPDDDRDTGAPGVRGGDVTAEVDGRKIGETGASRPLAGEEAAADHGLFDLDHFYGARTGAGPAEPAAAPDSLPGEEEPIEAGLRPDSSGMRHERDVNPRR